MTNGKGTADKGRGEPRDTPNRVQTESNEAVRNPVIQTIDADNVPAVTRTDELYVIPGLDRGSRQKARSLEITDPIINS